MFLSENNFVIFSFIETNMIRRRFYDLVKCDIHTSLTVMYNQEQLAGMRHGIIMNLDYEILFSCLSKS